jgi:hypothetical protein
MCSGRVAGWKVDRDGVERKRSIGMTRTIAIREDADDNE